MELTPLEFRSGSAFPDCGVGRLCETKGFSFDGPARGGA